MITMITTTPGREGKEGKGEGVFIIINIDNSKTRFQKKKKQLYCTKCPRNH